MRRSLFTAVAALAIVAPISAADVPAVAPAAAIGVDEIERGMLGHGESVFQGRATERFEVEVLGVLRDVAPGTSYILGRLSGHGLERTGVVAGMSGSPVWIDGRLAGAVAFSWPFAQEAIAGITPIEAMRKIPASAPWGGAPAAARTSVVELAERGFAEDLWIASLERLTGAVSGGGRSAVVWSASGFGPGSLAALGRHLPALAPGGGVERTAGELAPGSAVAAVFVGGDLRMAATGTVTERFGDSVLAFGHPVAGLGDVSLPMATAEVVTVLGSSYSSFKVANTGPVVGAFERDHAAGLAGRIGAAPRTVPLAVEIAGEGGRRFDMELARVPDLVGALTAVGTFGALEASTTPGGVRGVDLALGIELEGHDRIDFRQSFDGSGAANRAISFVFAAVDYLARSDLATIEPSRIDVVLTPHLEPRVAEVVGAHAVRRRLAPGESTEIIVELRNYRGEIERRRVEVTVPRNLSGNRYAVFVGDGATLDGLRLSLEPVEPRSFEQARGLLESLASADELVVLGLAPGLGAAAGGGTLPRLPPSVAAIWAGSAPAGRPLRTAIVERRRIPEARPLSGFARVDLEVESVAPVTGEPESKTGEGRGRRSTQR
jgi:hypothetical protein